MSPPMARLSTPRVLASAAAGICQCRDRPQEGRREVSATLASSDLLFLCATGVEASGGRVTPFMTTFFASLNECSCLSPCPAHPHLLLGRAYPHNLFDRDSQGAPIGKTPNLMQDYAVSM
jgi:hypothetical protein